MFCICYVMIYYSTTTDDRAILDQMKRKEIVLGQI